MRSVFLRLAAALVVCAAMPPSPGWAAINDDVDGFDDCQRAVPPVDFGDAPEGILAYPNGVIGHFPSCLAAGPPGNQTFSCPPISTPPGAATGFVRHEHPATGRYWLGCGPAASPPMGIDSESDAKVNDTGAPASACNTAISVDCVESAFGMSFGQDECYGGNDACLASPPVFHACGPGNVNWTIAAYSCATASKQVYLNILIDMNQDGDWNDNFSCASGCANEWAVKNFVVTLNPGCNTIFVPTFRVGPQPGQGWMRITLSDEPAPDDFPWNGSAGMPTQSLHNGETEDYPVTILPDVAPCPSYEDWGDAPENAAAYPGVIGHFPTCRAPGAPGTQESACAPISSPPGPTGYVRHVASGTEGFGFWLGCYEPTTGTIGVDSEQDGKVNDNGGTRSVCSEVPVDCTEPAWMSFGQDECYGDADAGIDAPMLVFGACQYSTVNFKAYDCANNVQVFLNILVDMNEDGDWNDNFVCVAGSGAPCAYEWAVKNVPIVLAPGCNHLTSPSFLVGPHVGKGWLRITLTADPVRDDYPWNGSAGPNGDGFWIGGETEDYPVVIRTDPTGVGDVQRRDQLLLSLAPNPGHDRVDLDFTLPRASSVTLAAFDLAGRKLVEIENGALPAGNHRASWDFRDASGRMIAPGYYVIKLRAGDHVLTRRGVRVR